MKIIQKVVKTALITSLITSNINKQKKNKNAKIAEEETKNSGEKIEK